MNKRIAVTGAGRGLGFSIASRHAEMGDIVHAFDYKISDELRRLASGKASMKVRECDISSTVSVRAAMRDLALAGEPLDVIYNVAGIYDFDDKVGLADTDLDRMAAMYNVNAVGALRVCKELWPLLGAGAVIVNISSEAGSIGACSRIQEYAYCMSKAALNMGAKIMSNELAPRGVRVFNLHPGWLRTVMGGADAFKSAESVSPEQSAEHIVGIALDAPAIPAEQMYFQHTREPLIW